MARGPAEPVVLRIAGQHGLAYLPLAMMELEGMVEAELAADGRLAAVPSVQWLRMGNATAIREAMLAGRLDLGFMGIPPFLLALDRGTPWRLLCGLSEAPLGLVSLRPDYRSLADLGPRDRIALPQPGSIQHILLAMAAERQLGRATHFDNQLVSLGHPEGLAALLAGREIAAQFTAPPYLDLALAQPGASLLLSGEEAFGGRFTFIIGVAAPAWGEQPGQAALEQAFLRALDRAIGLAADLQAGLAAGSLQPAQLDWLDRLSRFYELEESSLRAQLLREGQVYDREVYGLNRFIAAMSGFGYLDAERTNAGLAGW